MCSKLLVICVSMKWTRLLIPPPNLPTLLPTPLGMMLDPRDLLTGTESHLFYREIFWGGHSGLLFYHVLHFSEINECASDPCFNGGNCTVR